MSTRDPWVLQRGVLWTVGLGRPVARSVSALVPARFDQVLRDDVPELIACACRMDPIGPDALLRRLDAGRQCFAAWVDGSLAAYGWLTRGPEWVGEFERELSLGQDEAYIWDCATTPEHRRQHLFGALLSYMAVRLRVQGVRRLWIISLNAPRPLLNGVAAASFQPVLYMTYLRLYNRRALLTDALPGASRQDVADARRALRPGSDLTLGPLIVGSSSRPIPPDTHFDR